jgi:hypothetical protein
VDAYPTYGFFLDYPSSRTPAERHSLIF